MIGRGDTSIRAKLLAWLTAAVAAAGVAAAAMVYAVALHEADEIFDYQIRQMALSLAAQSIRLQGPVVAIPADSDPEEFDFAVQIWDERGEGVYLSPNYPSLPPRALLGFSNVRDESGEWRVYATQWGSRTIQVVQPMHVRSEMALASALRILLPLLLVVPLLAWAVWRLVGHALRPLRAVAEAVEQRTASALEPVDESGLPAEISPLAAALNRMLRRLRESIAAQRAFVGDAAHELRTPLAALRLQAQVLARTGGEAERRAAAEEFTASVDRATHLVEQLLQLARTEPDAAAHAFVPVRLDELAREGVSQFAAAAVAKGVDLGAESNEEISAQGDPASLRILLRNLLDNAVRYTPPGGRVDVWAERREGRPALCVRDSGPGIPDSERERVFARFYRVPGTGESGSGLGLAIARRVAELHGAQVELGTANAESGLIVRVIFSASRGG